MRWDEMKRKRGDEKKNTPSISNESKIGWIDKQRVSLKKKFVESCGDFLYSFLITTVGNETREAYGTRIFDLVQNILLSIIVEKKNRRHRYERSERNKVVSRSIVSTSLVGRIQKIRTGSFRRVEKRCELWVGVDKNGDKVARLVHFLLDLMCNTNKNKNSNQDK